MTTSSENPMSNIFSCRTKRRPKGRLLHAQARRAQAFDSVLPLTSPSTVLPVTCGAGASDCLSPPSRMPSLKPRTAPPKSAPMSRSFLVPNISITITRTISQCQMLNEPMSVSYLFLCSRALAFRALPLKHRAERLRPAQDVHVNMIHLLMAHPAVVDDGAKAIGGAGFA